MIQRLNQNFNELDSIPHHSELFKYREWHSNNLNKRVLIENELYFATPQSFQRNDPNDCTINLQRLTDVEIDQGLTREYKKKFPDFQDVEIGMLVKNHDKTRLKDFDNGQVYLDESDIVESKNMGVLCLTHNPLNVKMWEQYSNNHTGLCYGFNTLSLYNDLSLDKPVVAGKVLYCQVKPKWNPFDNPEIKIFRRIYTKDIKYSYEDEYRLRKSNIDNRAAIFENSTLKCVFLGAKMLDIDKEDVIATIKNKKIEIKIYECSLLNNGKLAYFEIAY